MYVLGCLWDDTLLDRSVCHATWEEWLTNLPLGEGVDSEFLDIMDNQNLVQVGG